jgi:hypothetical protein
MNCFPVISRELTSYVSTSVSTDRLQEKQLAAKVIEGIFRMAINVKELYEYTIQLALSIVYFISIHTIERSRGLGEIINRYVDFITVTGDSVVVSRLRDSILEDLVMYSSTMKQENESSVIFLRCLPYTILELWFTIENKVHTYIVLTNIILFTVT